MSLPVVSDSLQNYLAEINRFPILSKEEEFRLAVRYYEKKDVDAAHTLVTSNLRFVVKVALEYRNYGVSLKDLIQEGNIGLMTAVKKFNPYKGYRLITYAVWWIRSFIQDYILRTRGLVRRGSKELKKKLFYRNMPALGQGCEASGGDVRNEVTDETSAWTITTNDLYLDTPISDDDMKTHLDGLVDPNASQEELVAEREVEAIVKRDITRALALLDERERFVIENRVMAEKPRSLQRIGDELGLTRERVRQIEGTALRKLQKALSDSYVGLHSRPALPASVE